MNGTHIQLILVAAMLLAIHVLDVNSEAFLRSTGNNYVACGMVTVAMGTNATEKTTGSVEISTAYTEKAIGDPDVPATIQALAVLDEKSGNTARTFFGEKRANTAISGNTARTSDHSGLFAAIMTYDATARVFAGVASDLAPSSNARVTALEANTRNRQ